MNVNLKKKKRKKKKSYYDTNLSRTETSYQQILFHLRLSPRAAANAFNFIISRTYVFSTCMYAWKKEEEDAYFNYCKHAKLGFFPPFFLLPWNKATVILKYPTTLRVLKYNVDCTGQRLKNDWAYYAIHAPVLPNWRALNSRDFFRPTRFGKYDSSGNLCFSWEMIFGHFHGPTPRTVSVQEIEWIINKFS